MVDTPQIIPLYRRAPSELLQEWETEAREHSHTVAEFRRRLSRSDPDRKARFQFAIEVCSAHVEALKHRIARAKGLQVPETDAIVPEAEPEPRTQWQGR